MWIKHLYPGNPIRLKLLFSCPLFYGLVPLIKWKHVQMNKWGENEQFPSKCFILFCINLFNSKLRLNPAKCKYFIYILNIFQKPFHNIATFHLTCYVALDHFCSFFLRKRGKIWRTFQINFIRLVYYFTLKGLRIFSFGCCLTSDLVNTWFILIMKWYLHKDRALKQFVVLGYNPHMQ